jgi:hypothetical protein
VSGQPSGTGPIREVTCPRCWLRTDRVQSFEAPVVLFLIAYVAWTHERVAGCPRCVRARLWQLFWLSILAANLLFPLVGTLILWDIHASQRKDLPGIAPDFAQWAHLTPPPQVEPTNVGGKVVRLVITLLILAAVVVVMFVALPRLAG